MLPAVAHNIARRLRCIVAPVFIERWTLPTGAHPRPAAKHRFFDQDSSAGTSTPVVPEVSCGGTRASSSSTWERAAQKRPWFYVWSAVRTMTFGGRPQARSLTELRSN
jgi:hypothetical protein